MQPEFKAYAKQIVSNAQILAEVLQSHGYYLMTGGTTTHLLLINLHNKDIPGKIAEKALGLAGITVNKNTVPHDPRSPFDPSGIRLGTPALTTRGMKENDMKTVAQFIHEALSNIHDETKLQRIHQQVTEMCQSFPLPQ